MSQLHKEPETVPQLIERIKQDMKFREVYKPTVKQLIHNCADRLEKSLKNN